jgi:hypothetical protein
VCIVIGGFSTIIHVIVAWIPAQTTCMQWLFAICVAFFVLVLFLDSFHLLVTGDHTWVLHTLLRAYWDFVGAY